ncbi:DinB family protein [Ornithinibacillus halotolerans]|uniref:DinB-like domain-containing protein n=1 Tax=Ornithinibacillus halotolerans TaxID=1274357 RepID=A0A916WBD2_9BACI|nr:DinB family protein [Ornithinibacillus halotolerans]GGA85154.1 hypothetical protein GCM10008025_30240 [Ornithinibacillus halotolerans]
MNKTYQQFESTIDEITKISDTEYTLLLEPIQEGKWSIREIIGHLYYWDKYNVEVMVPKMQENANLPPFPDHDEHNAEGIAKLEGKSLETIIDLFIKTRKRLIDSILEVKPETRFTIGKGKRQFSGESFIKIFLKHDQHHLKQIHNKLA